MQFLDLRAALSFLGALDYILRDGNIGFCSSCKKVPPKSDLLFALYLGKGSKKQKKVREFSLRGRGGLPILAQFP